MNKPNRSKASIEQRRQYSREYKKSIPLDVSAAKVKAWRKVNPDRSKEISARFEAKRIKRLEELAGRPKPENCELCGSFSTGNKHGSSVKINWDHDHATGKFRGWLCTQCNMALGLVKDNPARLRRMADYLEQGGILSPSTLEVNAVVTALENL